MVLLTQFDHGERGAVVAQGREDGPEPEHGHCCAFELTGLEFVDSEGGGRPRSTSFAVTPAEASATACTVSTTVDLIMAPKAASWWCYEHQVLPRLWRRLCDSFTAFIHHVGTGSPASGLSSGCVAIRAKRDENSESPKTLDDGKAPDPNPATAVLYPPTKGKGLAAAASASGGSSKELMSTLRQIHSAPGQTMPPELAEMVAKVNGAESKQLTNDLHNRCCPKAAQHAEGS